MNRYVKFYDDTIETKFIKQLVASTYVPFISTWKPGDFVVRDMMYLTKDSILKCNHTGYPRSVDDVCVSSQVVVNGQVVTLDSQHNVHRIPYFTKVSPYVFGKEYFNVTGRYVSNISGYDPTTHFYLGQYLRMMRDVFDLDMMPFYNCYCGETLHDVDFNKDSEVKFVKQRSSAYKIMSVPVKFGKTYMISIDCDSPVEVVTAIYGDRGLLHNATKNLNDILDYDSDYSSKDFRVYRTYRKYLNMRFSQPQVYRTKDWHQLYNTYDIDSQGNLSYSDDAILLSNKQYDQGLGQYEKYLRLLIKVPASNKSSLVVIEGDYGVGQNSRVISNSNSVTKLNFGIDDATINSKTISGDWVRPEYIQSYQAPNGMLGKTPQQQKAYNDDANNSITTKTQKHLVGSSHGYIEEHKKVMFSPMGLLQVNDGNSYAFSNRLIEYLLQNVICNMESFGKNIERIQQYASSDINRLVNDDLYLNSYIPGVWSVDLQEHLLDLARKTIHIPNKVDITGNVDKDVERVITRGQRV